MEVIKATTQNSDFVDVANIYEKVAYYPTVIHEIEVIKLLSSGQIKTQRAFFSKWSIRKTIYRSRRKKYKIELPCNKSTLAVKSYHC